MQLPETLDGEMTMVKKTDVIGYVCPTCGVEPTDAKVRRYRMGSIRLRKPVAHLWYFRNTPNILSVLLNISAGQTDELLHFDSYTPSSPAVMNYFLHGGTELYIDNWEAIHFYLGQTPAGKQSAFLDPLVGSAAKGADIEAVWNTDAWLQNEQQQAKYGFPMEPRTTENCGAEAMHMLLSQLDLPFMERMLSTRLRQTVKDYNTVLRRRADKLARDPEIWGLARNKRALKLLKLTRQGQRTRGFSTKIKKLSKRLHYVRLLARKQLRPEWMIVSVFPVLPPDLRPMIQMASGRFAASDLNDLYRRLIYRKIRFDKFCNLFDAEFLPDLLIRHDLCLLQEAADAIIDNGRLEKPAQRSNKNVFKSLTAIIEGKHGRFRQNLLGKRVDYSGRSVIVVGPKLRLHQCGLPREMALELFHPFIIQALLENSVVRNIRAAKNMIQKRKQPVWDILDRVVYAHPLLLNRAPTLHRLGIQAFEPILLSGRAIQLHPLVCPAFNADFDGDQMAVHIPLSLEAQAEARLLMLATHNWLSPATGEPNIVPSQDMILGFYYLTTRRPTLPRIRKNKNKFNPKHSAFKIFQTFDQALQRYEFGALKLHDLVWVKAPAPADLQQPFPVEVRIQSNGHNTFIYDSGVAESWPVPEKIQIVEPRSDALIQSNPIFARVPQLHYSSAYTYYVRTTPGRLILNSLIYENLFL